jgi:hypothetical protein
LHPFQFATPIPAISPSRSTGKSVRTNGTCPSRRAIGTPNMGQLAITRTRRIDRIKRPTSRTIRSTRHQVTSVGAKYLDRRSVPVEMRSFGFLPLRRRPALPQELAGRRRPARRAGANWTQLGIRLCASQQLHRNTFRRPAIENHAVGQIHWPSGTPKRGQLAVRGAS